MQTVNFELRGEYIALCDLLKLAGLANSGGQAKHMVAEGLVTVDGAPESRKAAKIHAGQIVVCHDTQITLTAPVST
jgi:ribosome-associated protein